MSRTAHVTVRVTPQEKQALNRYCELLGISQTEVFRSVFGASRQDMLPGLSSAIAQLEVSDVR